LQSKQKYHLSQVKKGQVLCCAADPVTAMPNQSCDTNQLSAGLFKQNSRLSIAPAEFLEIYLNSSSVHSHSVTNRLGLSSLALLVKPFFNQV
jgi:hypothetical protein